MPLFTCPECFKHHRNYPWNCLSIANNRFAFDVLWKVAGRNDTETEAYRENKEKLEAMERYAQRIFLVGIKKEEKA